MVILCHFFFSGFVVDSDEETSTEAETNQQCTLKRKKLNVFIGSKDDGGASYKKPLDNAGGSDERDAMEDDAEDTRRDGFLNATPH